MGKFIKIEIEEEDNIDKISFTTSGLNDFEIIGMLTFYRDKIEVNAMHKNDKAKTEPEND